MSNTSKRSLRMKITTLFLVIFPFFNCPAQTPLLSPILNPKFEVASVRIADPGSSRSGRPVQQTSPGALTMRNVSIFACIQYAYQMPPQIVAPDWLKDIRLDIVAKAAEPVGDPELYYDAAHASQ